MKIWLRCTRLLIVFGIGICPAFLRASGTDADGNADGWKRGDTAGPPNIVYVMADDMGVGDVKCFGGAKSRAETPNIDRLARDGMMFTDAHAPAAHCIPTRVAVMTGRYAFRFRPPAKNGPWGFLGPRLPRKQTTLGTVLRSCGYRTGYVGKWHLGLTLPTLDGKTQGPDNVDYSKPVADGPLDHGFESCFFLPASLDMYPYAFVRDRNWVGQINSKKGWSAFNRVGPAANDFEDTKVLDTLAGEAESFIADQAASRLKAKDEERSPFLLYFALTSPHTPICPSQKFQGKSKLGLYGDFLMETDHCVGRVMAALEKHGFADNTLVIFTSDHGAASYAGNEPRATPSQFRSMQKLGHFSSGIYRGFKFSAYEGGTRVPFVVRWPGKVRGGSRNESVIGLVDLLATVADVAGKSLPASEAPDSYSLVETLLDPETKPKRGPLLARSTHHFTVRSGDWKLLLCPGAGCVGKWGNEPGRTQAWKDALAEFGRAPRRDEIWQAPFCQLFNLKNDPGETQNLAADFPQKVQQLSQILEQAIAKGRTTPGPSLGNDRQVNPKSDVPAFVWKSKIRNDNRD